MHMALTIDIWGGFQTNFRQTSGKHQMISEGFAHIHSNGLCHRIMEIIDIVYVLKGINLFSNWIGVHYKSIVRNIDLPEIHGNCGLS